MGEMVKIKLVRSKNGCPKKQLAILKSLRLTRLNKVVTLPDNPQIRGMIRKVSHLVQVIE
ncbi:MAG: 50S ribosomal protein L30 [Candidatus Desulfofervidaceae bacterium]|nr:50S ribosomal protein L30 [Candidatus Desulfofervidaceae bacterium]